MTHVNPTLDQGGFRGRNDDGSESAATWKATANTNWTQAVDENFRVRFLVQETAGGGENNTNIQLQYNLNGAGWNSVNATSNVVQSAASANFADEDSTTQQLGAGTFISPNSGMDEDNGLAGESNDIDFAGNDEVEVEYCCQILSADVADNDTVQLRVVRGDLTVLESYTNTPSVTVDEAGANTPVNMDLGSFTLTGQAASVTRQLLVKPDLASLTLTGLDNTVTRSLKIAMDAGALTLTGLDNAVTRQILVSPDLASLTLIGQSAEIKRQLLVNMDAGSLALSGLDAAITKSIAVNMDTGALTLTGQDAVLTRQLLLNMDSGAMTFGGLSAGISISGGGGEAPRAAVNSRAGAVISG